jgi:hypothetical protein
MDGTRVVNAAIAGVQMGKGRGPVQNRRPHGTPWGLSQVMRLGILLKPLHVKARSIERS